MPATVKGSTEDEYSKGYNQKVELREEYRRKAKEVSEISTGGFKNVYKGYDHQRKYTSRIGEEMSPSHQYMLNTKDTKRDVVRDKEKPSGW